MADRLELLINMASTSGNTWLFNQLELLEIEIEIKIIEAKKEQSDEIFKALKKQNEHTEF